MTLVGSTWTRTKDSVEVEVVEDSDAQSGRSYRSVRLRRADNGKHFWATPEGLARKYQRKVT